MITVLLLVGYKSVRTDLPIRERTENNADLGCACFPALCAGCVFSRVRLRLQIFPRLFALAAGCYFAFFGEQNSLVVVYRQLLNLLKCYQFKTLYLLHV